MTPVQAAAVDRALTADDPRTARRHLRLVAALDGTTPAGPLATAAAVTLAVGATAERPGPPAPPTPGARADDPAVRGAAVAVARFDRSLDAVTTGTGLPRAAVRRALAEV